MRAAFVAVLTGLMLTSNAAFAVVVEDVAVGYEVSRLNSATLTGIDAEPRFLRHLLSVSVGRGPVALGLQYQYATMYESTPGAATEAGVMLTGDWSGLLSDRVTLALSGRVGLTPSTDESNPLYATDTELLGKFVLSEPDGMGSTIGSLVFPSAYAGMMVNRFGRVQLLSGGGLWTRGFGVYTTVFHSVNGIGNPANPGERSDELYAALQNSGLTLSFSYAIREMEIGIKQNVPLRNGGNDLSLSLRYRAFLIPG